MVLTGTDLKASESLERQAAEAAEATDDTEKRTALGAP